MKTFLLVSGMACLLGALCAFNYYMLESIVVFLLGIILIMGYWLVEQEDDLNKMREIEANRAFKRCAACKEPEEGQV